MITVIKYSDVMTAKGHLQIMESLEGIISRDVLNMVSIILKNMVVLEVGSNDSYVITGGFSIPIGICESHVRSGVG
jgi:hypothetical protein